MYGKAQLEHSPEYQFFYVPWKKKSNIEKISVIEYSFSFTSLTWDFVVYSLSKFAMPVFKRDVVLCTVNFNVLMFGKSQDKEALQKS